MVMVMVMAMVMVMVMVMVMFPVSETCMFVEDHLNTIHISDPRTFHIDCVVMIMLYLFPSPTSLCCNGFMQCVVMVSFTLGC